MKGYIADNQFAKGSMLPKVEAALQFIEKNPKGSVLITSLSGLNDALEGKIGTRITIVLNADDFKIVIILMVIIYNNLYNY